MAQLSVININLKMKIVSNFDLNIVSQIEK